MQLLVLREFLLLLLEKDDIRSKLEIVTEFIQRELKLSEIQHDIKNKAKDGSEYYVNKLANHQDVINMEFQTSCNDRIMKSHDEIKYCLQNNDIAVHPYFNDYFIEKQL